MTIGNWLQYAISELRRQAIVSARLDALILLEDVTGLKRSHLLTYPEQTLSNHQLRLLKPKLEQRLKHLPLAYIRGFSEFYGHQFQLNPNVLIPRPESEAFLDLLRDLMVSSKQSLIDVGTGSGALAISAKRLFPDLTVIASDISEAALEVAANNATRLRADINFKHSFLIEPTFEIYHFILANLPYVPLGYTVSAEVMAEPSSAIFAADNGLAIIKQLSPLAYDSLKRGGYILIESLLEQQSAIKTFYETVGFRFLTKSGLVQVMVKD